MNIRELLFEATALLKDANCDSPRLDAELLLMHVGDIRRTDLIVKAAEEVTAETETAFRALLERRAGREPLAYIIGEKEFWSRPFHVTSDVLIPRPETEHLVEAAIEALPDHDCAYHFCDIGTGSGCIALTLACEFPNATVVATDISTAALTVAKGNAETLGVAERVTFRHGDMLEALAQGDGPFDVIISNPPYVAYHEMDELEAELAHEPRGALTDEADGLKYLSTILNQGEPHLKSGGLIIVETGPCGLPATPSGLEMVEELIDLAGHLRGGVYKKT